MREDAINPFSPSEAFGDARAGRSANWDEIEEFCSTTYMPYRVRPLDRLAKPDAIMTASPLGRITVSRFAYGTGVYLNKFDPETGRILVLNTIKGALNHHCDAAPATTSSGESFVVDCSRTDYWLEADPAHLQFNLTVPHDVVADVAAKWFGFVPDDALWTRKVKFGGPQSRWIALMGYVSRSLAELAKMSPDAPLARHLEETVCLDLLQEWAGAAGVSLASGSRSAAPYYVRQAEELMTAEAREAPTIGQIARRVGVSARSLSEGFRRFRGITPREFLAAQRLERLRAELEAETAGRTVTEIAAGWGFANKGALAAAYRARFGELPSQTLMRGRHATPPRRQFASEPGQRLPKADRQT
ncbi:AraC family transcriptional regulator [Thetidibacter halocola]|uniref:AraC family transcriptional regulator n=1 Tax=Thetidibacter halocola TaxID=2827239 RepID=A0A8J7WE09_9RHOB|nr:helix-turn-helix transcriptional regulator [Thetidibacter halocola]MBS0125037.1 AraC family transcriptional regulator [Thetidibacter halocola]